MTDPISRRRLLGAATASAALAGTGGLAYAAQADSTEQEASWKKRWAPYPNRDKLAAFEGVEDDRGNSHPGGHPHIFVRDNAYYFHMHTQDEDTIAGRQRQEVKGMRSPAGGGYLVLKHRSIWRLNYQVLIPDSLRATTSFTHMTQLFTVDIGPSMMVSLRKVGGRETIELKDHVQKLVVGRADLDPLRNRWIDIQIEFRVENAPNAWARFLIKDGSSTVIDETRTKLATNISSGRVRPKWGIYRSLDDADARRDSSLRIRDMRAYQRVW